MLQVTKILLILFVFVLVIASTFAAPIVEDHKDYKLDYSSQSMLEDKSSPRQEEDLKNDIEEEVIASKPTEASSLQRQDMKQEDEDLDTLSIPTKITEKILYQSDLPDNSPWKIAVNKMMAQAQKDDTSTQQKKMMQEDEDLDTSSIPTKFTEKILYQSDLPDNSPWKIAVNKMMAQAQKMSSHQQEIKQEDIKNNVKNKVTAIKSTATTFAAPIVKDHKDYKSDYSSQSMLEDKSSSRQEEDLKNDVDEEVTATKPTEIVEKILYQSDLPDNSPWKIAVNKMMAQAQNITFPKTLKTKTSETVQTQETLLEVKFVKNYIFNKWKLPLLIALGILSVLCLVAITMLICRYNLCFGYKLKKKLEQNEKTLDIERCRSFSSLPLLETY